MTWPDCQAIWDYTFKHILSFNPKAQSIYVDSDVMMVCGITVQPFSGKPIHTDALDKVVEFRMTAKLMEAYRAMQAQRQSEAWAQKRKHENNQIEERLDQFTAVTSVPSMPCSLSSMAWSNLPIGQRINLVGPCSDKSEFTPWLWHHMQTEAKTGRRWDFAIFITNGSTIYNAHECLGKNNVCHELNEHTSEWFKRQIQVINGRPWLLHLSNFGKELHDNVLLRDLIENSVAYNVDIMYDHQYPSTRNQTNKLTDITVLFRTIKPFQKRVYQRYVHPAIDTYRTFEQMIEYMNVNDLLLVIRHMASGDHMNDKVAWTHERRRCDTSKYGTDEIVPGLGELEMQFNNKTHELDNTAQQ